MSKLTVELRGVIADSNTGMILIDVPELLELINSIEDYELIEDEVDDLNQRVKFHQKVAHKTECKLSEIVGLPRYLFDKTYGTQKTPVGEYIMIEDVTDIIKSDAVTLVNSVLSDTKWCDTCGVGKSEPEHDCPYEVEHEAYPVPCTCCEKCMRQCVGK